MGLWTFLGGIHMEFKSVFDIIGPIMIGPSSSHTAGAARIGLFARKLFGKTPQKAVITLFGSFAKTYKGHGTDVALVGGLLNFSTDDERIPQALELAKQRGLELEFIISDEEPAHPNTVKLELIHEETALSVVGESIGGGKMRIIGIDSYALRVPDAKPSLFIVHDQDEGLDALGRIRELLQERDNQIQGVQTSKGKEAKMNGTMIELHSHISHSTMEGLRRIPQIKDLKVIGGDFHV